MSSEADERRSAPRIDSRLRQWVNKLRQNPQLGDARRT